VEACFVGIGALCPGTASPIASRDELVQDMWEGFRLVCSSDGPFFGVTIKCLMKLVEIFSTPVGIGECRLKLSKALLHFPFPMDRLEDAPFSINAVMKVLGIVGVSILRKRLFRWNVIKKELSPSVAPAVDSTKRSIIIMFIDKDILGLATRWGSRRMIV